VNELDEMREYLELHLHGSHGFTEAEVKAMALAILVERHMDAHETSR
jgi:hypothetical protein